MMLYLLLNISENENSIPWLIYFALGFVFLWMFFFLLKLVENCYSSWFGRPLYRNLFIYRKLSETQKSILRKEFTFYNQLSPKHQRQFEHRVAFFLLKKQFHGREQLVVEEKIKLLVAAVACMLSFGRKNYWYVLVEHILLYPKAFYSSENKMYHKGEFNPKLKVIAMSQPDFEEGYEITNDNLNLGIHEFMHAMQMEAKVTSHADSTRFNNYFKKIILLLRHANTKQRLEETQFFRRYAFTNQYEFTAVLAEYFFESPKELKQLFPELYDCTRKMLNFRFAGY